MRRSEAASVLPDRMPLVRIERPTARRRAIVLALVFMASYAYFYEGGGWNQNTRFDLVRAIIERGTLRIDGYDRNTGDKAVFGGHVYADKAPGASLTALPAVALARDAMRLVRRDVYTPEALADLSYVATVTAAALPAAVAAVCVFWIALLLGADDGAATVAAIACGLGTPLWAYATLMYESALAGGCLMAAFLGVLLLGTPGALARDVRLGLWIGLAAGWAGVTELQASIPSALIVVFAWWQLRRAPRTHIVRVGLSLGSGLAIGAIVLLTYNWLAFGSPFHIGYASEAGSFEAMHTGIFGVSWPNLRIAGSLLFGPLRGLVPLAPVLVVGPVGFWMLVRRGSTRGSSLIAGGVAIYYFALTSGYFYWNGGWSYGSRHLGPALPFICLGIAPVWQRGGAIARAVILALMCVSVGESLVAVATTPQPPIRFAQPMRELLWPAFRSQEFPIGWQSALEHDPAPGSMSELVRAHVPRASWNLGERLGLHGWDSLVPLLVIWFVGAIAWLLAEPSPKRTP